MATASIEGTLSNFGSDGCGMAAQLVEICAELGTDELRTLTLIAERLRLGRKRYGNLQLSRDSRVFSIEALEEAIDGMAYAAAALLQAGDQTQGRNGK